MLVVDGANVVGSVPDGWWRDRRAAAERLRDRLESVADTGLDGLPGPLDVILVVEGRARGIAPGTSVRVVDAPASGDDAIVDVVAGSPPGHVCVVVTADRELRTRVRELGAQTVGPSAVPR